MIGNWKSSAILGLIAVALWVLAFAWYFVGIHRVSRALERLRSRLGIKAREDAG